MCQYCEEKALPCMMCGRACMEYQFDRSRCGSCAHTNRPPKTWPVFEFCPYCGRELYKNQEQEEMRAYHKWTTADEHDLVETIRMGGGWSEAAEKIGIGEDQAYNHYRAMRRYDKTLPMPPKRENKKTEEETMSKEKMKNPVPDPEACADPKELKPKGEMNPLEQEMARMIEEREENIVRLLKNIEELSEEISGRDELIKKLTEKIAKKDRIIAGMAEELYQ